MLIRKFKRCSHAVKCLLFKTFCGAIYCSSLWCTYTDKIMNRFKIAYNNMFRKLFDLPYDCSASEMFAHNFVPAFVHLRRTAMYSIMDRVCRSSNKILQRIAVIGQSYDHKSTFWHVRDYLLYNCQKCRCAGCTQ